MKLLRIIFFISLCITTEASGQMWLWGKSGKVVNDGGCGEGESIAMDGGRNVYLAGWFIDTVVFGKYIITASPKSNGVYLVKFDSTGNVLWVEQSNATSSSSGLGMSVAVDRLGNSYVTGIFTDTITFGPYMLIGTGSTNGSNAFLVKYDPNGKIIWAVQTEPAVANRSIVEPNSIAIDAADNIYITGTYRDSVRFGPYTIVSSATSEGSAFIAKYNLNGNIIWVRNAYVSSTSGAQSFAVTTDLASGIYIAGGFRDSIIFGNDTLVYALGNAFTGGIFLVKYDSNGNTIWARQSKGTRNDYDFAYAVAADYLGNVYITGEFNDTATFGATSLVTSSYDMFLAKYDNKGNLAWAAQGFPADKLSWCGRGISTDFKSNIYVACGAENSGNALFVMDKDTLSIASASDPLITMKLDSLGNLICGSITPSGGDDESGIVVSKDGKYICIGGDIWNSQTVFGQDTIPAAIYANEERPFMARWMPCEIIDTSESAPQNDKCVFVPDAFSPNGDGENDILYVRGDCIKSIDFIIYNRWGEKIFESYNMVDGWDGTYKNKPLNTGSFAYKLRATLLDGTIVDKKGNVALIR